MLSWVLDEHRGYLADRNRVDAYRRAISQVVEPGSVVVDLGTGTAILGMLAAQAGARHVYAIEETSFIGAAREIVASNGLTDQFTFIRANSTDVVLPELADVVVADQVGQLGFQAGIYDFFTDARERLLTPDGKCIPFWIEQWMAPIEDEEVWGAIDFWDSPVGGLDFSSMRPRAANARYLRTLSSDQLLSDEQMIHASDPSRRLEAGLSAEVSFEVQRAGTLHGVGGWFRAHLAPNVSMSSSPVSDDRTSRRQVFLPISEAARVDEGDVIVVTVRILPSDELISWEVVVDRQDGREPKRSRYSQSSFNAMLLSTEDLARSRPDMVPTLSPRGEARRAVFNACDGRATVADIEGRLLRDYGSLFATRRDAALFVTRILNRDSI